MDKIVKPGDIYIDSRDGMVVKFNENLEAIIIFTGIYKGRQSGHRGARYPIVLDTWYNWSKL